MHRTLPLLALLLASACRGDDRPPAPAPAAVAPPALADATQTALARDVDDADRRGTWYEVKHKWQGQQVRWTVTRQRVLCASADACHVAAFPIQRPAKQGWLPKLELAPGQYAAIESTCGARAQCEITVEGTLSRLELSAELPTSVTLSNVKLVQTTAQR
ncbi:MAG TPA: hypothetical protein VFQ53_43395 [Kofleriaceae bacterium]|nr:hypothetical protein [Kofleriaceae bacterium]